MVDMTVFISYSHANTSFAERLQHDLQRAGVKAWRDTGLRSGREWRPAIAEQIAVSDVIVLLASPESAKSVFVQREITEARDLGKQIITIRIAGMSELGDWQEWQMINGDPYDQGLATLCRDLGLDAPPSPRAILSEPTTLRTLRTRMGWGRSIGDSIAAPVLTGPYGTGYLAGPPDQEVSLPGSLNLPIGVLLRFTGNVSDVTLTQVQDYLRREGPITPWMLYVEGPAKDGKLSLPHGIMNEPEDGPPADEPPPFTARHVWDHSARICESMLVEWAKLGHSRIHVFVQAPSALSAAVGVRLRALFSAYTLHHYFIEPGYRGYAPVIVSP